MKIINQSSSVGYKKYIFYFLIIIFGTLACSLSGVGHQAKTLQQTSQALRTDVSGFIASGGSLLKTAQTLATEHPGILETVKVLGTKGAPLLSTIQAAATNNPGIAQIAKALVNDKIPNGEPPSDIPIIDHQNATNFIGSSQYIIFTTPDEYQQTLDFYKTEMPNNGWQYLESNSHEYANAAQLSFYKDTRTATVNLSLNPLNHSTVIVITIQTQ